MGKTQAERNYLAILKAEIEGIYGTPLQSPKNFTECCKIITARTHKTVSNSTMKRIYGYVNKVKMKNSENKGRRNKRKHIAKAPQTLHNNSAEHHFFNECRRNRHCNYIKNFCRKRLRNIKIGH